MGCVPSSNAPSEVDARASQNTTKVKHVELSAIVTTQPAGPAGKASIVSTPMVSTQPVVPSSSTVTEIKIESGVGSDSVDEKRAVPDATVPNQLEPSVEPVTDPVLDVVEEDQQNIHKASEEELMLDFETFILFPAVQEVLSEGHVGKDMMFNLFQIVDKDADGYVNDQEREDLLELISLSYGAKSKANSPVNGDAKKSEVLPPVPQPGQLESPAASNVPPTNAIESRPTSNAFSTEENAAQSESPVQSEASTSTKSIKSRTKPKVIKFAPNPELQLREPIRSSIEVKSVGSTQANTPVTVVEVFEAQEELEPRDAPPQKKGFMLTRRESFGNRGSGAELNQSRFFNLDNGTLSYMDSTSRKPPFSMIQREIALKDVGVQAHQNCIELTPNASDNNGGSEQDEDSREVVILELKSEKDCDVWMAALKEHMSFALNE